MIRACGGVLAAIINVDPPVKVPNSTIERGCKARHRAPSTASSDSGIAHSWRRSSRGSSVTSSHSAPGNSSASARVGSGKSIDAAAARARSRRMRVRIFLTMPMTRPPLRAVDLGNRIQRLRVPLLRAPRESRRAQSRSAFASTQPIQPPSPA